MVEMICRLKPGSSSACPAFKRRIRILINNLHVAATASRFMPLSLDASSMDGLKVHGAIIDELHAISPATWSTCSRPRPVAQDPAGNLKPAKDKSTERIDGIVAIIMAIGRAMVVQEEPPARVPDVCPVTC